MADTTLAQSHRQRHKMPTLSFAGAPRNHEALRKRIVRDLERHARECERKAARARKCAAALTNVSALKNRGLFADIVNTETVGRWIADLLGVWNDYCKAPDRRLFLIRKLYGDPGAAERAQPAQTAPVKPHVRSLSQVDAVAEATKILMGGAAEIDWTREPSSCAERIVRQKYIERLIRKRGLHLAHATIRINLVPNFGPIPSDLAKTLHVLDQASKDLKRRKEAQEMTEIQREILFGKSTAEERSVAEHLEDAMNALNPVDPETLIARIFGDVAGETEPGNAA